MIQYQAVSVRYPGAPSDALRNVTLAVPAGHLTAVVGPNGSGKSTLVRALLGRAPVTSGSISVDGKEVGMPGMTHRDLARHVAVVVQREEPAFPMEGRAYLSLGRTPHLAAWGKDPGEDSAIDRAARLAGVAELLERRTDELSGGEWQRLRLARAIVQDTRAVVLDEPTTFLDVAHEMSAFELLALLARRGNAVMAVSHQLNLVSRFADQVILLHRGRVVATGSPEEVMQATVLESVYEWPLVVSRDPAVGAPTLVPLRRTIAPDE